MNETKNKRTAEQIKSSDDLFFAELVVERLLACNLSVTDSVIHNIASLQQHWKNVEFELKFEITENCNLNCAFCHQEFGKKTRCRDDFPLSDYKNIIDAAKLENQIKYIRITGGEPLLHPNVKDFLQYAADREFDTILNTNATLLTEEIISNMAQFVGYWKISFPSIEKNRTDSITEVLGTWSCKNSALQLLKENNCNVDLLVVLTQENIPHISEFLDIAERNNATCSFLRQESNATDRTPLTSDDIEKMVLQLEQQNAQVGLAIPFCAFSVPERLSKIARGRIDCGPYSSLVVSRNGKVHQCYSRRKLQETKHGFIKTAMFLAAEDFIALPTICQTCRYGANCLGGCRCNMALKNSAAGSVDYLADLNNISNHINNTERDLS